MLLAEFFTADLLQGFFSEIEGNYEEWVNQYGIDYDTMSDQDIYNVLPAELKGLFSDMFEHTSWDNDGQ